MFKELILKSKIRAKIKNLKKTASSESGRSMVEMLGVLGIMGVLSIGAIAGYRYAVDQHKANETINELTLRAVSVGEQVRQNRGTLTMDEFPATTRQGYPVTAFREPDDPKLFELEVTDVPVGVCQKILKMGWKLPVLIKANEIVYGGNDLICEPSEMDNRETATMVFLFDEDLDETALPVGLCRGDADCGSCQRCQENICVSSCVGDERCAQDTETGEQICCPQERRSGPYCCRNKQNGMCCNEYNQCCPWYKPLINKDGNCYTCDYGGNVDVGSYIDNCFVCSERELSGTICRLKCPSDKPMRGYGGNCYSCDTTDPVHIYALSECYKCPNRIPNRLTNDTYCMLPCPIDKPIMDAYGRCYACDDKTIITVDFKEQCTQCSERVLYNNRLCTLPCPDDKPLRGNNGECYSCDQTFPISTPNYICLKTCPNRITAADYGRSCILPCGEGIYQDQPLLGRDARCYSCDSPTAIRVNDIAGYDQNRCVQICPNRELVDGFCLLKQEDCPSDRPIRALDNTCHACDDPNPIQIVSASACSVCPNRVKQGGWNGYCALPCDEGIYQDKPLVGGNGQCYACDTTERISVDGATDNCRACPNRHLDGVWCVLNE